MISTAHPRPLRVFHPYANIHPQGGCDRLWVLRKGPSFTVIRWHWMSPEARAWRKGWTCQEQKFLLMLRARTQGRPLLSSIDQSVVDATSAGLLHPQ